MSNTDDSMVPPDALEGDQNVTIPDDGIAELEASTEPSRDIAGSRGSAGSQDEFAPLGMRRIDENGSEIVDAMAGRASVFGFGFDSIVDAIQQSATAYLGDASAFEDDCDAVEEAELKSLLHQVLGESNVADSVFLCPTADTAIEKAISLSRVSRAGKAFRTIAMLGSDHGRTAMCRTASGRPELHEGFGPMMAGFAHVPPGDLGAVRAVVDDQTACIVLSPIQLLDAARPIERDYLVGLRAICDEHDILLVIDETQTAIGSSGHSLTYRAIAEDISADMVVLSAGLFAGLPGGIVIARRRVVEPAVIGVHSYPMQNAVACATLSSMLAHDLPSAARAAMQDFAVALAESIGDYEFVRDLHVLGFTIGIETDIESVEIVRAARSRGLRLEAAGETAVRVQPPLIMDEDDRESLLRRVGESMQAIKRETAELGV